MVICCDAACYTCVKCLLLVMTSLIISTDLIVYPHARVHLVSRHALVLACRLISNSVTFVVKKYISVYRS